MNYTFTLDFNHEEGLNEKMTPINSLDYRLLYLFRNRPEHIQVVKEFAHHFFHQLKPYKAYSSEQW